MSENFIKLKNKLLKIRLLKAGLIGFSCLCFLTGAFLLLGNYKILALEKVWAWVIGAVGGILSAVTVWLVGGRTDQALAKQLDENFSLREKTQTMLEYTSAQGLIYDLQRDDANEELGKIPPSAVRLKHWWAHAISILLSASVLASSFFLGLPEIDDEEEPTPEVPFAITAMQRAALEKLIENVTASEMQSPYRENVVVSLTVLLDELLLAETMTERNLALEKAVGEIYEETDESSPVVEIVNALWRREQANVRAFVGAMNYYAWTKGKEWDSYYEGMLKFRDSFVYQLGEAEEPNELVMAEATATLLTETANDFNLALIRSGISNSDSVYAMIMQLNELNEQDGSAHLYGINQLASLALTLGYETTQTELTATLDGLAVENFYVLEQCWVNTTTGEDAMKRLASIFEYKIPAFERPDLSDSSGGEAGDQAGSESTSPPGTDSENVYGSDEKVLDPTTGEQVKYGELFGGYSKEALDKIRETGTEEEIAAMEKYFDILAGVEEKED